MKTAIILDADGGGFGLEYDNTRGSRNSMRLEAQTYEGAIREARVYLGITAENLDAEGFVWQVE